MLNWEINYKFEQERTIALFVRLGFSSLFLCVCLFVCNYKQFGFCNVQRSWHYTAQVSNKVKVHAHTRKNTMREILELRKEIRSTSDKANIVKRKRGRKDEYKG